MGVFKKSVISLALLVFMVLTSSCTKERDFTSLKDGDIIFQESRSKQSEAIQLATHSKYSHVGVIFMKDGEWQVLEAIQPVKYTALGKWVSRGKGDHYVIKRLVNADDIITAETGKNMQELGEKFIGRDYDRYFGWSDDRIYCSELVWKIYNEVTGVKVGPLKKMKDFDLSHKKVKTIMKKRYGENIPLEETVISPGDMFDSEELVTIVSE